MLGSSTKISGSGSLGTWMYCAAQIHQTGEVRRAKPSSVGSSRVEITISILPRCRSSIRNGLRPTSISRRRRGAARAMWLRIGGRMVSAMSWGEPLRNTPLRLLSRREFSASSLRQHLPRMPEQLAPRLGQLFLPPLFLKQAHTDSLLQALHVLGDRRLSAGEVQAGFGKTVVIHDCDEGAQQFQVQGGGGCANRGLSG